MIRFEILLLTNEVLLMELQRTLKGRMNSAISYLILKFELRLLLEK